MAKQAQNRKSYTYSGPVTALDPVGDIGGAESRILFPGTSYTDLAEDHPIVGNLIARKLLIAETGQPAADTAAISTATTEGA